MVSRIRLGVVGGGAAGVILLNRLVASELTGLDVTVVEAREEVGPGFPYSSRNARPEHLQNHPFVPDIGRGADDFLDWMGQQSEERLHALGTSLEKVASYRPASRLAIGEYMKDRFALIRQEAGARGFRIDVRTRTTGLHAERHGETFRVRVRGPQGEEDLELDALVLSTGYWCDDRSNGRGYLESPWPSHRLVEQAPSDRPVAVLGTGPTCIDTVRTLAHKTGRLRRDAAGHLVYEPHPGTSGFKIIAYSRSGHLSQVRGAQEACQLRHTTRENIQELQAAQDGFCPLDEVFELLKRDAVELCPELSGFLRVTVEEAAELLDRGLAALPPAERLRQDLARAQESVRTRTPIPVPQLLYSCGVLLGRTMARFPGEDMARFDRHVRSILQKVVTCMPIESAELLLALMEAGRLEVVATRGNTALVPREEGGALVRLPDGTAIAYDFGVNGRAQDLRLENNPSLLIRSLAERGEIGPALVPYRDPRRAEEDARRSGDGPPRVRQVAGRYYYDAGGIGVDPDSFRAASPRPSEERRPALYVVGPENLGQFPYASGLGHLRGGASLITGDLEQTFG